MKSINNDSDEENSNSHNWLGFSLLSPHHIDSNNNNHDMKISSTTSSSSASSTSTTTSDVPRRQCSQTQLTSGLAVSTGADLQSLPPQLSYGNHWHGVFSGGENSVDGPYSSPLSGMPLRSDGSVCLMEDLSRSQAQGAGWNRFPFSKFTVFIYLNS